MRTFAGVIIFMIMLGCASRSVPTGGPRDEDPPELISVYPPTGTTNFKDNKVILEFNEKVDVSNLKEELLITPNLDIEINYSAKKNIVEFEFEDGFPDSTTVSLNFRNAVVDITEKNPATNLVLAFSTGTYIDSLLITGNVNNLFTGKPMEGYSVGLYPDIDSVDLFNSEPSYQFKTDKTGTFQFHFIKNGIYKIYAFLDKNKNGTCESGREPYGFFPQKVKLDSNINQLNIQTQFLNLDTLEVSSARQSGQYYFVKFNKPITNYKTYAFTNDSLTTVLEPDNQTIRYFNTFEIKDSLQVFVEGIDSASMQVLDTVYLKFEESSRKPDELKHSVRFAHYVTSQKEFIAELTFSKPISAYTLDSVKIQLDSSLYILPDTTWQIEFTNKNRQAEIRFPDDTLIRYYLTNNAKKLVNFQVGQGSFISLEQDSSIVMNSKIDLITPDLFGVLAGGLQRDSLNATIELLNKDYKVVKRMDSTKFRLQNLKPDTYIIRAMVDKNGNGRWDPGNVYLFDPPEPIWYYEDPDSKSREIPLKANWEVIDLMIVEPTPVQETTDGSLEPGVDIR